MEEVEEAVEVVETEMMEEGGGGGGARRPVVDDSSLPDIAEEAVLPPADAEDPEFCDTVPAKRFVEDVPPAEFKEAAEARGTGPADSAEEPERERLPFGLLGLKKCSTKEIGS